VGSSSPSAVFIPNAAESWRCWWHIHLALIYFLSLCLTLFSSFAECLWSDQYAVPLGLRNIRLPMCFNNSSFYFSTVQMPSSLTSLTELQYQNRSSVFSTHKKLSIRQFFFLIVLAYKYFNGFILQWLFPFLPACISLSFTFNIIFMLFKYIHKWMK